MSNLRLSKCHFQLGHRRICPLWASGDVWVGMFEMSHFSFETQKETKQKWENNDTNSRLVSAVVWLPNRIGLEIFVCMWTSFRVCTSRTADVRDIVSHEGFGRGSTFRQKWLKHVNGDVQLGSVQSYLLVLVPVLVRYFYLYLVLLLYKYVLVFLNNYNCSMRWQGCKHYFSTSTSTSVVLLTLALAH